MKIAAVDDGPMVKRGVLKVAAPLAALLEEHVLPRAGIEAQAFWAGAADLFSRFAPENRRLLDRRVELQERLDAWHEAHAGQPFDAAAYEAYLRKIGYLVAEPAPFEIDTQGVDPEVATRAGPQLVVPALNARFVLNAANARWGSLYDALYGSDALPDPPRPGAYDARRGDAVVVRAKAFLDEAFPLDGLRWSEVAGLRITPQGASDATVELQTTNGAWTRLHDAGAFVGHRGPPESPTGLLLRRHGLHVELVFDRESPIGARDPAGLADVVLEAALSTIVDLEDSIAAVDAQDKTAAYAAWLGLMTGELEATFEKDGRTRRRTLAPDRAWTALDGSMLVLPGRSLLFVRNVGHLMTTPAVRLADGREAPEGVLDALVTAAIGAIDIRGGGALRNSATGSIYIVKPKMHGPEEAACTDRLFDAVEDILGLPRHTVKVGVMDEERRTSANLAACIHAVRYRLVFINTGFLDRTGDEIHSLMRAGPMVRKGEMKAQPWIAAYEARNVAIGLACGLGGRAQIGKGMWAAPDRMADMLREKIAHPRSGANTAWTPSPTAATLHALHYHAVDAFAAREALGAPPPLGALLRPPLAEGRNWTPEEVREELDTNTQGILGYVVRWIDQGVGCSKVPDLNGVGLMEDRATLRISSQHIANWLLHDVCSLADVDEAFARMAVRVDGQNADDPDYQPMATGSGSSLAFQAARALVLEGAGQPSGYTEPVLHDFRRRAKSDATVAQNPL